MGELAGVDARRDVVFVEDDVVRERLVVNELNGLASLDRELGRLRRGEENETSVTRARFVRRDRGPRHPFPKSPLSRVRTQERPNRIYPSRARAARRRGRVERTYEEAEFAVVTAELDRRRERRVGERERGRRDDGGLRRETREGQSRVRGVRLRLRDARAAPARRRVGITRSCAMKEN